LPSDALFLPIFVPARVAEAVSDRAWLAAMLSAEAALARAEARVGVIPADAAETIAACCEVDRFDIGAIAEEGRRVANPVEPLVRALVAETGDEAGGWVHWGATSQDVLDTAAMLVSRDALDSILAELDAVSAACAGLAEAHRTTPMAARTLLQQAVPTTFGLVAAGWLVSVVEARERLRAIRTERLAAQLGGAGGTLAALGPDGPAVARAFAEEVGLPEAPVPWHTLRVRVAELGAALDVAAGALGKIALDVTLLAQTEVAELTEGAGGGSSAMPQKQNPVGAVLTSACARTTHGHASVLTASLPQEHQRAAGAWQAEWLALSGALAFTGGAVASLRETLEGLEVHPERMGENLARSDGLVLAEQFAYFLAPSLGRPEAQRLVGEAARRCATSGRSLAAELAEDAAVTAHVDEEALERAMDAAGYLGSAAELTDRALERYRATDDWRAE
jgi:3-carboxy-cis,cis-muconate cycloisomerase